MTSSSTETYEDWLARTHGPAHSRRTAQGNAAFFLPHLKPGMWLLDAGCGPGSITIGLAEAVAPGGAVGIDLSAGAVERARTLAAERGCDNMRFEQADVRALPFDDASFDAAFAHALLQHVEFPLDALKELRRVLKPGGVIGVADADFDGAIMHPTNDLLDRSDAIMARTRRHPRIGKHLRALLHEAGFVRVEASATAGARGTAQEVAWDAGFWARYFEAEPFIAHAESRGWATRDEMLAMASAWRAWGREPGAFSAAFRCEAVGLVEE